MKPERNQLFNHGAAAVAGCRESRYRWSHTRQAKHDDRQTVAKIDNGLLSLRLVELFFFSLTL